MTICAGSRDHRSADYDHRRPLSRPGPVQQERPDTINNIDYRAWLTKTAPRTPRSNRRSSPAFTIWCSPTEATVRALRSPPARRFAALRMFFTYRGDVLASGLRHGRRRVRTAYRVPAESRRQFEFLHELTEIEFETPKRVAASGDVSRSSPSTSTTSTGTSCSIISAAGPIPAQAPGRGTSASQPGQRSPAIRSTSSRFATGIDRFKALREDQLVRRSKAWRDVMKRQDRGNGFGAGVAGPGSEQPAARGSTRVGLRQPFQHLADMSRTWRPTFTLKAVEGRPVWPDGRLFLGVIPDAVPETPKLRTAPANS